MLHAEDHQAVFDHLYDCLSILDSKSSSLLGFNSIIAAVFAIFMTAELAFGDWVLLHLGMGFVLVSALLLLSVVWVHWSSTEDLGDLERHAVRLLDVRYTRTVRYRLAWYFAVASVVLLSVFLLLRVFTAILQR